ncbi:hypothetical protein HYPP_01505 [Hyphomicrobium sp. ghe19]|nr:hypothetical protein HYPP_01505 [Hyphomicrobium sp. ghe19]
MEDALSPTREQLRRATYEPPQVDQQTDRRAWRKLALFDQLYRRSEIEYFQFRAAEKLEQHWYGAQGHDVRLSDETGGSGERLEYPRSYHAQMVERARLELLPREWLALQCLLQETEDLASIGRKWRAVGTKTIARSQGLMLVSLGLERLAFHWGFAK